MPLISFYRRHFINGLFLHHLIPILLHCSQILYVKLHGLYRYCTVHIHWAGSFVFSSVFQRNKPTVSNSIHLIESLSFPCSRLTLTQAYFKSAKASQNIFVLKSSPLTCSRGPLACTACSDLTARVTVGNERIISAVHLHLYTSPLSVADHQCFILLHISVRREWGGVTTELYFTAQCVAEGWIAII